MIDFIVKYWIEFLFGLIISGMGRDGEADVQSALKKQSH